MLITRRLLREEISYSQANKNETNILYKLIYWPQRVQFYNYVHKRRGLIEALIAYHLGLNSPTMCYAVDADNWMHGSFNLYIPVTVENSRRVLIRFPLPYRVSDKFRPGNGDEKIRYETRIYTWLQ
jgi:hypothetical protein